MAPLKAKAGLQPSCLPRRRCSNRRGLEEMEKHQCDELHCFKNEFHCFPLIWGSEFCTNQGRHSPATARAGQGLSKLIKKRICDNKYLLHKKKKSSTKPHKIPHKNIKPTAYLNPAHCWLLKTLLKPLRKLSCKSLLPCQHPTNTAGNSLLYSPSLFSGISGTL